MPVDAEGHEYITWCLATNPSEVRQYRLEAQDMLVAEMVMYLADTYMEDSDQIMVMCIDMIPYLEDELKLYVDKHIFVHLLAHLREEGIVDLWPLPIHRIEMLADMQRGPLPLCKQHYPSPAGKPKAYSPLMILRGGMKHEKMPDPKTAMRGFAIQKIEKDAPVAIGPTMTMLLKAETRTITAILNAKSAAQTKEVITAAFRRAGLPSPFRGSAHEETQPSSSSSSSTLEHLQSTVDMQ